MDSEILAMSDEEFMQANSAEDLQKSVETETEEHVEVAKETVETSTESDHVVEPPATEADIPATGSPVVAETTATESAKQDAPAAVDVESTAPDYEGFYKRVMAPIAANGKTVEIRSPEEAIQLMQMGANYTKKMQAIAPYRKIVLMLENNGLLDEARLSYLIDLDKRDPEAIKKLIKDSGIDPLDIDTSVEPSYREGNHRVTDEEVAFTSVLEDVKTAPGGVDTLQKINTTWDQASKEALWKEPQILSAMHQQMASGVYDVISAEVDRLRTLGRISPETPFIQAYRLVGDAMVAQRQQMQQKPAPVAVRTQTPVAAVAHSAKAAAAASTSSSPRKATTVVNPLAMSDDDFLKSMENRL